MCDAGDRLPRDLVGVRQHFLDEADAVRDGLGRAAGVLDAELCASSGPSFRFSAPISELIWLASQPNPIISTPAKLAWRA